MILEKVLKPPIARLACLFLASRLALLAVGLLATSLLPSGIGMQPGNLVWHQPVSPLLEIWARWDSEWFLLIASEGYQVENLVTVSGSVWEHWAVAGFLPLYPLLIRVLAPLFGAVGAGVLISNVCLFLSLVLLERLLRLELGDELGETAGLAACAALLIYPSSLFLSAVYSESLFLMMSLGVFLSARQGRFAAAGVIAAFATLTRPFGLLLVIPIVVEFWFSWRRRDNPDVDQRPKVWEVLWVSLAPLALAGYMAFCRSVLGDPLAFIHHKTRWRGAMSGPWRAFVRWWEAGPTAHGTHGSTVELIIALVCLAMLVVMVRRLRLSYTLYTAAAMTLALGSTLWSFSRLALTLFPFFMLIGMAWADGRRCMPTIYAFSSAALGGLFMALFANWWWVG